MSYDRFHPGKIWMDADGKPIQAHGFSVLYRDGTYYWFGENKEFTRPFGKVWTWGVRCYTSKDLYNWEDRGLIIPPSEDLADPLHSTYCVDRPHILYCERTGKFVCWIKVMGDLMHQFMCVLQADDILGPYECVHKFYNPLHMNTGDFALCEHEGKGYLLFERPHHELITATLAEDYTAVTGEYSTHYKGLKPPETREGVTYFLRNGKHYLFTSGTTGYYPNPSRTAVFDSFHGEYRDLGSPHVEDRSSTSFNSQLTCVLRVPGTELYIAMADRWLPRKKTALGERLTQAQFARMFRNYVPDESPVETAGMPGKAAVHFENTRNSTYVWLPIQWEGDRPVIRWYDEWKLEDFL